MPLHPLTNPAGSKTELEGVIKFSLHHKEAPITMHSSLLELNAWRNMLFELGLTGRDPSRYGGLGYGNMSIRVGPKQFIISGSQTGGIRELELKHYVLVLEADHYQNRIESQGPIKPSSESMTHAAAYAAGSWVQCVLHVHHPAMWTLSETLGLPTTPADAAYGTIEMAAQIERLVQTDAGPVIAMLGHTDGLIAIGRNIREAGHALIDTLIRAHVHMSSGLGMERSIP